MENGCDVVNKTQCTYADVLLFDARGNAYLIGPESAIKVRPTMPFAGPETALRATISAAGSLR